MWRPFALLVALIAGTGTDVAWAASVTAPTIVCAKNASFAEKLAAKEIRRYFYLRTGRLPEIASGKRAGDLVVVSTKDSPVDRDLIAWLGDVLVHENANISGLSGEQYLLKSADRKDGSHVVLIIGGDPIGALDGAYRFCEHLGVRFYMHGDVVPDEQIPPELPKLDEVGRPLFALRGIQPFHDFPEGPDWWTTDDYKAIIGQLPKMRMNFIGLHTYPQGGVGLEPAVWIGRPEDLGPDGHVKAAYPARHFVTSNNPAAWGSRPMKTSEYVFGAASLFDRDDYGADYMRGVNPWNKLPEQEYNALFDRMGDTLHEAFTLARLLGVKTCIGTETPLTIPDAVKKRLRAEGKNPADPAVVEQVYEAMFQRIAKTHPLDYYWLWTPEGWTWSGCSEAQIKATESDLRAAMAAAEKVKAPFTLATCGWVLGPPQNPSLFDNMLPKNMPMSCISRTVGNSPVEPGFRHVEGRPKWSIPWMEDDPGLTIPQLWAGRMRRDAADSLAYGCTGLMGIHWRTRILAPNVSALAQAAWDQKGWNPEFDKKADDMANAAEGPDGGAVAKFTGSAMAGTDDPTLYQTVRYNMRSYRLSVPDGTYTVTLKFCEPAYHAKGVRVFGVNVQGRPLVKGLDIFARVGQNRALDLTMNDVKVTGGKLAIDFPPEIEFPCIAAIAIVGRTAATNQFPGRPFSRKINCGGPAYKDYEADLTPADSGRPRYLPVDDFYADWARAEFGPEASKEIAAIFTRLDGHLPRPADWVTGPGSIRPDNTPWEIVQKQYDFADELCAMAPAITGMGNRERFNYWRNQFFYLRSIAEVRCVWARYNAAIAKVRAEKSPEVRKRLAREVALPVRKELVAAVEEMHRYLLATVSNAGELGNVCNWQQQTLPVLLTGPGKELATLLGEPLPADAEPSREYPGPGRIIVPTVRTAIAKGEPLKLTVILAGMEPREAALYWRPLGQGEFAKIPLAHVARSVYQVIMPKEATQADFEYYIRAAGNGDHPPRFFPATAPKLNQTVVTYE